MYSALVDGKYTWMNGTPSYFPIFSNLFRKNDISVDYESQTDQAAGIFLDGFGKNLILKYMQSFTIMILKRISEICF